MRILLMAVMCVGLMLQTCCAPHREYKAQSPGSDAVGPAPIRKSAAATPSPESRTPMSDPVETRPNSSLMPVRLEIPAIGLKAGVDKVGLLPDGAMDVPKAFDRVGLLYPSVLPGQNGNAVIDGHVDHYTGPAVFFYLKRLKPGDSVILSDRSGRSVTFVVSSVEAFITNMAPLGRIFGPAQRPRLNLITCTGKFNRKTKEHAMRLVVFTEMQI